MEWSHVDQNLYVVGGQAAERKNPSSHKYTEKPWRNGAFGVDVPYNVLDIWEFSPVTMKFVDLTEKALLNADVSSPGQKDGTEMIERGIAPHFRWDFGWTYSGIPGKMILYGGHFKDDSFWGAEYHCEYLL